MTALAALVLASTLTAADRIETPSSEQPAVTPVQQSDAEAQQAERRAARLERRRRRMLNLHAFGGVALEVASTGLHALTALIFIGADWNLPKEGCAAPDMPCSGGTPVVLMFPAGAVATGWIGATRVAAAREAKIWRSPMFWAGTAMTIAWIAPAMIVGGPSRNERLTVDAIFVASLVSGTAMQLWGAFLAPPLKERAASRSLHVAPGCGPTLGGVVCGLALAGF